MIGKLGKEVKALKKILIVEDDQLLNRTLAYNLTSDGYEVISVFNFDSAVRKLRENEFDVALLDINLPDGSGLDLCEEIRNRGQHTYIIFITAKDTENDTVTGFNIGADDYISKPFSLREVAARVKAVLRRTRQTETERAPEQIAYKSLVLDIIKKKVSIDGEEAPLTKKEFEILLLLLQNKGRVFSREDILSRIWSDEVYVLDRTIDVNITRLRKKIGIYGKCIVTRLGYGYCFEAE